VARLLVEAGSPLETRGERENTPLLLACRQGFADVVKALLARGANADATDDYGSSAITLAAEGGFPQIASMLFSKAKTGLFPPELAYFIEVNR
jgi:ankyrin repeat protein